MSRQGSNLSLDSTDDGTPSRIPTRRIYSSTQQQQQSTPRPQRLYGFGSSTPNTLGFGSSSPSTRYTNGSTPISRPRTPSGLASPASPATPR